MFPVTLQIPVAVLLLLGGLGRLLCRLPAVPHRPRHLRLHPRRAAGDDDGRRRATPGRWCWPRSSAALIGAIVLNFAYFLGVVLVGAAFGAMVATMLWGRAGAEPHVLIVILFAVVGAVGAMLLQRFVIIVGTAFGGAWTALVGGLALLGDRAAQAAASANNVWVVYPLDPAPGKRWVLWVWLGLGLAGTVTQLGQGSGPRS